MGEEVCTAIFDITMSTTISFFSLGIAAGEVRQWTFTNASHLRDNKQVRKIASRFEYLYGQLRHPRRDRWEHAQQHDSGAGVELVSEG